MSKLKICGLKRLQDIQYVNQYSPDYVGFVFAKSTRQVTPGQAAELKRALKPEIRSVGVFVNEEIDRIITLLEEGIIDFIQLHGDEDIAYVKRLQEKIGRLPVKGSRQQGKIIKAIRVSDRQDIEKSLIFPTDYLLFDTYTRGQYGGSGECFDWKLLKEVDRPFFLAGGLQLGNIQEAVEAVHPYCLDISSGAETDGVKDEEKIRRLVETVKAASGSGKSREIKNFPAEFVLMHKYPR